MTKISLNTAGAVRYTVEIHNDLVKLVDGKSLTKFNLYDVFK